MKARIESPSAPRRLPVGAEIVPGRGVHFRVWAPLCREAEVRLEPSGARFPLSPEPGGYFSGTAPAEDGSLYRFLLDGLGPFPDPASRFQPRGPHGPSRVVDPERYRWRDAGWSGLRLKGQVLYELHVGTFTAEGSYASTSRRLRALADVGVTAIELMPLADYPGRFGWGYDGVDFFSPSRLYGEPDDLRRLVDDAHAAGLGVLLDVVYNHPGPDGNYLREFSPRYFGRRRTEWGDSFNYDGPDAEAVRSFMAANARHWIEEYHLDGLRFDATQSVFDASEEHVLARITEEARAAARGRSILVIAENEPQDLGLLAPVSAGGWGVDAVWNDDFHHSARVALLGARGAYYNDYAGTPQELISAAKWGTLFQGQVFRWQNKRRGKPSQGVGAARLVNYLENHDQVANSDPGGRRLAALAEPAGLRAQTAFLLLAPGTPLLFQGQERGVRTPFVFFADHSGALGESVERGRRAFMAQFRRAGSSRGILPDPRLFETFAACRLGEPAAEEAPWLALHRDLLRLRRRTKAFARQDSSRIHGSVLAERAFSLRYFDAEGDDRLLVVNLGAEIDLGSPAEPTLAPPRGARWILEWCSEEPRYGGGGVGEFDEESGWRLPAKTAMVLRPEPRHG